jgi:allophanate hydrolase
MRPVPVISTLDLKSLARIYHTREASPHEVLASVLEKIAAYPDPAVWICRVPADAVYRQVEAVEKRRSAGETLPLFGVPFAIKDSIDLAGFPTTVACPAYSYIPERSATVVQRLLDAGAIAVGKTNLDQFGTGLAGDRSPYGACRNVFNAEYISGGSSSGSGVAVAAGLVSFALGTDTAGSGRVPAAANNVVGLKQAPGLLSTKGLVPSCASLDCISFVTLTAEDADFVYSVAQGRGLSTLAERPLASFAVPAESDLDFGGDRERAAIFQKSVARLEQGGARRITIDYTPFREAGLLLYGGPWVAERLSVLEDFMSAHADEMYPVTRSIIEGGRQYRAVDVFRAQQQLRNLREACLPVFEQAEVLLVPTIPTLPKLAEVQADSFAWSRRLGTYTNFANLVGLSALAVPAAFTSDGLPAGITLLGPPGSERRLCEIGVSWQRQIDLPLGATGNRLPSLPPHSSGISSGPPDGYVRLSVAGAHLKGEPFHAALCKLGARFVRACRTAPRYTFFAFLDLNPPRPGLLRLADGGRGIAVEIYDLSFEGFGKLVASVAPPLSIGTVELEDGEQVKGFLCESSAAARARDITEFGGWIAFRSQTIRNTPSQPTASS